MIEVIEIGIVNIATGKNDQIEEKNQRKISFYIENYRKSPPPSKSPPRERHHKHSSKNRDYGGSSRDYERTERDYERRYR